MVSANLIPNLDKSDKLVRLYNTFFMLFKCFYTILNINHNLIIINILN